MDINLQARKYMSDNTENKTKELQDETDDVWDAIKCDSELRHKFVK